MRGSENRNKERTGRGRIERRRNEENGDKKKIDQ